LRKQARPARARYEETIMTTPVAATTLPARTHRSSELLAISATTFLVLGVGLGVRAAFWLAVASAVIGLWVAAARRFPVVAILTHAFFFGSVGGLISGLLGYRGGYYGFSAQARP
jgi:hypothetical protein